MVLTVRTIEISLCSQYLAKCLCPWSCLILSQLFWLAEDKSKVGSPLNPSTMDRILTVCNLAQRRRAFSRTTYNENSADPHQSINQSVMPLLGPLWLLQLRNVTGYVWEWLLEQSVFQLLLISWHILRMLIFTPHLILSVAQICGFCWLDVALVVVHSTTGLARHYCTTDK